MENKEKNKKNKKQGAYFLVSIGNVCIFLSPNFSRWYKTNT